MDKIIYIDNFDTPIDKLYSASSENSLIKLSNSKTEFINWIKKYFPNYQIIDRQNNELRNEISEYFSGNLKKFSSKIKIIGTAFQIQVLKELKKIPFGKKTSYGELATKVGRSKAGRAIGNAMGKNPIMLIIPCHRVVRNNGDLGGFSGGIAVKKKLLEFEEGSTVIASASCAKQSLS